MITFRNVIKYTFIIYGGVFVGRYLEKIFVEAPIKAVDKVLAKKLHNWVEANLREEKENENEDE